MVETPVAPEQRADQRERAAPGVGAVVAGTLSSALIVGLSGAVMASWQGGLIGDLLLSGAALGLLFRLPHTIPVWSALTLLAATAGALLLNDQDLAERFANLTYYGLSVGCLWALWELAVARWGWWLPLPALLQRRPAARGAKAAKTPTAAALPRAAGERP